MSGSAKLHLLWCFQIMFYSSALFGENPHSPKHQAKLYLCRLGPRGLHAISLLL